MFRKPKKKPAALRSNSAKNDNDPTPSTNTPTTPSKKRRRSNDSSDEEDDGPEQTNDLLSQIRQERESAKSSTKKQINTSSTTSKKNNLMHQYKSSNDQLTAQQMATRTAEHHPLEKPTAETSINQSLPSLTSNQPRNKFLAGPLKAPTFVRTTARFDYQPDICKDYKDTGFCGYGDTCIYLHDRGDTKSGWEMEREYEEKKRREEEKREREVERFMGEMSRGEEEVASTNDDDDNNKDKDDDGIPFACHICRGPFKDPIVTSCNHYFCGPCMSTRVREVGMGCPVCQKDTHGVLNFPQKLVAKKRRLIGRDGTWDEFFAKKR